MSSGISYEIRTVSSGKIYDRVFVQGPQELYNIFKAADTSKKIKVFKILRDSDANLVSCEELRCTISGNSFVVKTIFSKPAKPIRDTEAPSIILPDEKADEQVYDIALLLKTPLAVKRILPANPRTSKIPNRPEKTLKKVKKVLPVSQNARRIIKSKASKVRPSSTGGVLPVRSEIRSNLSRNEKTLKKEGKSSAVRKTTDSVSRGISNKARVSAPSRADKSHRKS